MITLLVFSSVFLNDTFHKLHYVDLQVSRDGSAIVVSPKVRMLESQRYGEGGIPQHLRDLQALNLDGPILQVMSILTAFDEARDQLFEKPLSKPMNITSLEVEYSLRKPNGSNLSRQTFTVKMGLEPIPGKAFVRQNKTSFTFDLERLSEPNAYEKLLTKILTPPDGIRHSLNNQKSFLANLYFLGPHFEKQAQDMRRELGLKHAVLRRLKHFKLVKTHLGSAFCQVSGATIKATSSEYLKFYGETLNAFGSLSAKLHEKGAVPELIPELESYLGRSPTDVRAMTALVEALVADDRLTDAYGYLSQNRAFFRKAEHRKFRDKIEALWSAHRHRLMDQRAKFQTSDSIRLNLLSPRENDTLGGRHMVRFEVENPDSHFLCADLFLQDKKVGSISGPPFEMPIQLARKPRYQTIRLATYFEDKTYREANVDIKVLPIDDEEEVNLARLRAVVTKGPKKFVTDLKREDFELYQMNAARQIEHFRRDKAPLRVAVVMDTSQSMTGKKLYRAQFAVRNFLKHLGPEDKVALYTFDQKVLRLSDFSPHYKHLLPRLFTLSPMLATSLNDAIYAAHRDLSQEQGNKVMIVLSDGDDTLSVTNESDIRNLFVRSRILFYPILLYGNYLEREDPNKSMFLHQLASMTGSVVFEVEKASDLNSSFDQIYKELKSFYYMDFYSLQRVPDPKKIRLKARGSNTQVRFHIYDDNRPVDAWMSGSLRR